MGQATKWMMASSVAAALALGCGESEPSEASSTSPLIGTWRQTTSENRTGNAAWSTADDVTCRADNVEEYTADGGWTLYDGTIQCGQGGTGIVHGTWRLAASDAKIVYTYEGASGEYEATVELMTETQLVLTHSTGATSGMQVRNRYEKDW